MHAALWHVCGLHVKVVVCAPPAEPYCLRRPVGLHERHPNAESNETKLTNIWVCVSEDTTAVAMVPNVEAHTHMLRLEDVDAASDVEAICGYIFSSF